jgi:hypothetical protein
MNTQGNLGNSRGFATQYEKAHRKRRPAEAVQIRLDGIVACAAGEAIRL